MGYEIGFDSANNCVEIESKSGNSSINLKPDGSGAVKVNGSTVIDSSKNISCVDISTTSGQFTSQTSVTISAVLGAVNINAGNSDPVINLGDNTVISGYVDASSYVDAAGGFKINDEVVITNGTPKILQNVEAAASIITTGIFDSAQIPNLDASKITTGTFASAQIPNLSAGKITTGTMSNNRIAHASTDGVAYYNTSTGILDRYSTMTLTKLGYLSTITSDVQAQLNAKASTSHTHTFASLTSKPTTLSGYGITDAAPSSKGVTNGDSHNHAGGDGASIPLTSISYSSPPGSPSKVFGWSATYGFGLYNA